MSRKVRQIFKLGDSMVTTIPPEFGFKVGEHITVEKINDNELRIRKLVI